MVSEQIVHEGFRAAAFRDWSPSLLPVLIVIRCWLAYRVLRRALPQLKEAATVRLSTTNRLRNMFPRQLERELLHLVKLVADRQAEHRRRCSLVFLLAVPGTPSEDHQTCGEFLAPVHRAGWQPHHPFTKALGSSQRRHMPA
jgi:hypothetical protein